MTLKRTLLPMMITTALVGCQGTEDSTDSTDQTTSSYQVEQTFTATLSQVISQPETAATRSPLAVVDYFEGTLTAVDTQSGETFTFDWPVTLDDSGFLASQKTVTLPPGTYDFTLLLEKGSQQYTALLYNETIEDANDYRLKLEIQPVVGDTITDFDNIKLLSGLGLQFDTEELALAQLTEPKVGLIIDGGEERIFAINPDTGLGEIILNLADGPHSFELNFYDGNQLVGHSIAAQQNVDIKSGDDLNFDIIALQADITVDFEGELDQARFVFKVPQQVIDHVDGAENLQLLVRLGGGELDLQESLLTVYESNGDYLAEVLLDDPGADTAAIHLEFQDTRPLEAETVASCSDTLTIGTANTLGCELGLVTDYVIGGSLLGTVAINVLDPLGGAQAGAEVYLDNELIGLTGEHFGTPGAIKTHVVKGDYTVKAVKDGLEGSEPVTVSPLAIENVDVILDQTAGWRALPLEGTSCKTILDSGQSIGDGVYTIDPDGEGGADPVETYCDMTTAGGGWTLVQNRYEGIVNGDVTLVESLSTKDTEGALNSEKWVYLRDRSTELMATVDADYYVGPISAMINASCKPLSDTLSDMYLFHAERSGCDHKGYDYSLVGGFGLPYSDAVYADQGLVWTTQTGPEHNYGTGVTHVYVR